ncbi:MAG: 3-deoxy-8-phosphooctulonate synthase [Phycisphaerales bacterium]|nr:3-deoxy-8-phosphooctulonate synthase [Phycisphaerales bacterium]
MSSLDFPGFFSPRAPRESGDLALAARGPLLIIAGPCVLEAEEVNLEIAMTLRDACAEAKLAFVFKASFDKANRSSVSSPRGPGLERGCDMLSALRERVGVAVTTDIHEPSQAARAAKAVDILQIPAFLARQTDLLAAAAATGRAVNVKKGQFMAPAEMAGAIGKLREAGATQVMVTERGTFFGYHRLVNDFVGIADLMDLGVPVCFDATHSTQRPGEGTTSGGHSHRAPLLARAAVAAGVDAVFLECHPKPEHSLSDPATIQPLALIPALLRQLARLREAASMGARAT